MLVGVYLDLGGRCMPMHGTEHVSVVREVGVVPGQELQVHRARTQAAGACAGHVCAQLHVLAAGRPAAQCAQRSR